MGKQKKKRFCKHDWLFTGKVSKYKDEESKRFITDAVEDCERKMKETSEYNETWTGFFRPKYYNSIPIAGYINLIEPYFKEYGRKYTCAKCDLTKSVY